MLGTFIIAIGLIFVIVSHTYKKGKIIWSTNSIVHTLMTIEGVPCTVIFLEPYHVATILTGKFEEVNNQQVLVRISPHIPTHGLPRALTPFWYRETATKGSFSITVPPFLTCEIDIESTNSNLRTLKFECNRIEVTKPFEKLFQVGLTMISIGVIILRA
jgi:hypothetical protein